MHGIRPVDEDRLPWLQPYQETGNPGRPLPRRGYGKPIALGIGAVLLLAAGAGGYWLGQRSEERPQRSATIVLPQPEPAPVHVADAAPASEPVATASVPAEPIKVAKPEPKQITKRRSPPRGKIGSAGVETDRLNAVRAAQHEPSPARPAQRPVWPKMPSPGPAGQVIQLGAFTTPVRANNAYQARIARYPTLAHMPQVIVPVVTKPDRRVLYVLRLGTTSRQQSKTVCRNLRASGDHCLVIG